MRALSLAVRMLAREWRSGELGVLLLALTVAVASLTGVGFLVSRIGAAVDLQASEVLAADVRLGSPQPISQLAVDEAARRGLRATRSTRLLSVVFNDDRSQLTNIHAVGARYPLRGHVLIAEQLFVKGDVAGGIPPRGEVWPDSRLLAAIGAQVGSTLSIGAATFRVSHVLISIPDQGGTFAELAPSLLMNLQDLPATQLVQPGSRVSYSVLFAAERARIDDFKSWLLLNKAPAERLRDIRDASPQIKSATERAASFLSLASLVSVLLCAIAVAMSARRYVYRRFDVVALMKTLGATRAFTLSVSLLQLLAIAVLAALAGSGVGFVAQLWLLHALQSVFNAELPPASLRPLALGFMTAIALLVGFALPSLLQLARVPAIRVLRRDIGPPPTLIVLAFAPAAAVIAFLIFWVVRDVHAVSRFLVGPGGIRGAGGRCRMAAGALWRVACAAASGFHGVTGSPTSAAGAQKASCRSLRSAPE